MPRIPYPDLDEAHERIRKIWEGLPIKLNVFRILLHAERNVEPLLRLGGTILARQDLAGNLRELAILRVAHLSKAPYEWVQHVPIALQTGCTQAQVDALERGDVSAACFDGKERAVLTFTDEVVKDVRPSDQALQALEQHLSSREVVELTIAIGFYMLMARVMEVTGIEVEPAQGDRLVRNMS
ncbi:MAG: carboxymuconolactone decarboxylase family protein [Deltaproteobacteria bacterium]|nr:carboxymuconolactone decarboxylase family protein [Deltaproteobacteria bacterium]